MGERNSRQKHPFSDILHKYICLELLYCGFSLMYNLRNV